MESIATRVVWPIIRALGLTAISQGVLIFLKGKGYDVANWVATLLDVATSQENISAVSLIIAGVIGIFGSLLYEYWKKPKLTNLLQNKQPSPIGMAQRDTKMRPALMFIEKGKWPEGNSYSLIAAHKTGGELPSNRVREAAKYDQIKVWGKPSHNAQYDLIPADYWKIWQIDWYSNPDGECQTEVADVTNWSGSFKYYDLMVNKSEIETKWPPKE